MSGHSAAVIRVSGRARRGAQGASLGHLLVSEFPEYKPRMVWDPSLPSSPKHLPPYSVSGRSRRLDTPFSTLIHFMGQRLILISMEAGAGPSLRWQTGR